MARVFLKPGVWTSDSPRFAVYCFKDGDSIEPVWLDMVYASPVEAYYASIPDGYSKMIFVRMNPASTENNWDNKWNQSDDLAIPTENDACYINDSWDNWIVEPTTLSVPETVAYHITVVNGYTTEGSEVSTELISKPWGEEIRQTIYPKEKYQVAGATITSTSGKTLTYTIENNDVIFTNTFEDVSDITITLRAEETLEVSIQGVKCEITAANYSTPYGGDLDVNVTANKDYQVKGLTIVDGDGNSLTYEVSPSGTGNPTTEASIKIKNITSANLTITCCIEDGYYLLGNFVGWGASNLTAENKLLENESNSNEVIITKDFTGLAETYVDLKVVHAVNGAIRKWIDPSNNDSALMLGEAENQSSNVHFEYSATYPKFTIYCTPLEGKYYIKQKYKVTTNTKNCTITSNNLNGIYLWSDTKQFVATLTFAEKDISCVYGATMGGVEVDSDCFTVSEGQLKPTIQLVINEVTGDIEITAQQASKLKNFILTDITDLSTYSTLLAEDTDEIHFNDFDLKKDHVYVIEHGGKRLYMTSMWNSRLQTLDEINNYSGTTVGGDQGAFNDNFTVRVTEFTPNEDFKCNIYIRISDSDTKARLWVEITEAEKATLTFQNGAVYSQVIEKGTIFGTAEKYAYKKSRLFIKFIPRLGYKLYAMSANDVTYRSLGEYVPVELRVEEDIIFTPEMEVTGTFKKIVLYDKNTNDGSEIPLYPKTDVSNISFEAENKTLTLVLNEIATTLAALDKRVSDLERVINK